MADDDRPNLNTLTSYIIDIEVKKNPQAIVITFIVQLQSITMAWALEGF